MNKNLYVSEVLSSECVACYWLGNARTTPVRMSHSLWTY